MGKQILEKGKLRFIYKNGEIKEIDLPKGTVFTVKEETEPDDWHRDRFDRNKDGFVHPQIAQDLIRIGKSVAVVDEKGYYKSKYDWFGTTLSPKPKPLQKKGGKRQTERRKMYKSLFTEEFEKKKDELKKFENRKLIVYLCFYLRKKYFESTDIDNYPKLIIDALKPYIGDDSYIISLHLDKKQLYEDYPKQDLDFLETTLFIIADEKAKQDICKAI